jgi:hypothetical protein
MLVRYCTAIPRKPAPGIEWIEVQAHSKDGAWVRVLASAPLGQTDSVRDSVQRAIAAHTAEDLYRDPATAFPVPVDGMCFGVTPGLRP